MVPLHPRLFCIPIVLAIVNRKLTAALRHERGVLFERDGTYDGVVPNDSSFYIKSITGLDRTRCCAECQHDRPGCVGVLYNRKQLNCKLLKRYLTIADKDDSASTEEWEYLRMTRDFDDCRKTPDGWDYNGKIKVTETGRTCQAWASQSPHSHSIGTNLPENYCRNPDDEPAPWCYTTDPNKRFELCNVPHCVTPPLECITDQDPTGLSYFGTQNVADTGDPCQRWDSQSPHTHRFGYLDNQDNYCRNPDGENAPWCFTLNPNIRWRECIIPRC